MGPQNCVRWWLIFGGIKLKTALLIRSFAILFTYIKFWNLTTSKPVLLLSDVLANVTCDIDIKL